MKKVIYVMYAIGFFYVFKAQSKNHMAKAANIENIVTYLKAAGMEIVFTEQAQFRMDFES